MFILYQSNSIEVLKHIFLYVVKKNLCIKKQYNKKLFFPIDIIIQDYNMSFFLKMFLSKYLGICANFNFVLPAKFIFNLYKILIPDISEDFFLNKNNLVWIIMNLLPKLIHLNEFNFIKKYLNYDEGYKKLFSLSYRIADIYDKYLVYRVDWLKEWENYRLVDVNKGKEHQLWQSILWREIINFSYKKNKFIWNRSKIFYKIIDILTKESKIKYKKPNLFIFNVSCLPNLYLDTFYLLSKYVDLHYFFINLSNKYWFDKYNLKHHYFSNDNYFDEINYKSIKYFNPLLINYGRVSSDYLILLNKFNFYEVNSFLCFSNKNLLNIIKNDILSFKNSFILNNRKILSLYKDDSIKIYSCNGYLDEVKKLRNYLLDLILNKYYKLHDIVVYVSDLNIYYPYINSVFLDIRYKKYLSINIMENNINYDIEIFNLFINFLNIFNLNYNFSEICFLLKNKVIFSKFNIDYDELNIILNITKNVGICCNINNYIVNYSVHNFDYYTLINGIKRILLGYFINDKLCIWNDIVPYSLIENNFFYNILEKFSDFLFKVINLRNILNKSYSINDWILISRNILDTFFNKEDINGNIFLNKNAWSILVDDYSLIGFKKKINVFLFIKIINIFLKKSNKVKCYSINSINFCSLISLRMIQFKIVCFIGMNDHFPKDRFSYNFDLMDSNYRIGDRNKIELDKFLFLESLVSAKDKVYISYLDYSYVSGSKCFPSILINNLFYYINILNKNIITKYDNFNYKFIILNKIKKRYFNIEESFKKYNFNYSKYIYFDKICCYWSNPVKFFLRYVIKLNYFMYNLSLSKKELFNFDIKRFYFFRIKIINFILCNKISYKDIFLYLQYLNFFPSNSFGKIIWDKEKSKIMYLIDKITKIFFGIKKIKFNCWVNGINIFGAIDVCCGLGVIKWLPKNLNLIDGLIFWIHHIIYCYLGGINTSYMYGYNGIWSLEPVTYNIAKEYLNKYLFGYLNKRRVPMLFLPKSSNVWIMNAYNLFNKEKKKYFLLNIARNKLYNFLYGNFFYEGEINDIYISNFINFLNYKVDVEYIIAQSEVLLLPVFNNLKMSF